MTECFTTDNIVMSNIYTDIITKKNIRKIHYKNTENKLMVETPIMVIETMTLQNTESRIKLTCRLMSLNDKFINTLERIDDLCYNKLQNGKEYYKYVNDKELFTFYIPIYNNNINILIEDKNKNIVSIKKLKKNINVKFILLLSHLEINNNIVYLNWNIIQIKLI